jgi:hypothetical protein
MVDVVTVAVQGCSRQTKGPRRRWSGPGAWPTPYEGGFDVEHRTPLPPAPRESVPEGSTDMADTAYREELAELRAAALRLIDRIDRLAARLDVSDEAPKI